MQGKIIRSAREESRLPDDVKLTKEERSTFEDVLAEMPSVSRTRANLRIAALLARAIVAHGKAQDRGHDPSIKTQTQVITSLRRTLNLSGSDQGAEKRRLKMIDLDKKAQATAGDSLASLIP